jgi:membrane protease YdiL (CAAX protease family)
MKTTFSQKHPYWAAILLGLLCTIFTALGTAVPQIMVFDEVPTFWFMTVAVAVSAGIGMLVMAKSRFVVSEYGFNKHFHKSARKVLFYIPLLVIELIPIIVCGFSGDITPSLYIAIAFFTIAVGFNEEIYFRGLAFKFLSEKGVKKAVVWSSIIFGLLHIANALSGKNMLYVVLQISFAFLVGFVLAEIVSITKSIWVVIIWHTAHDFIAMATNDTLDTTSLIILSVQSIILFVYAVVLWKKHGTNRQKA